VIRDVVSLIREIVAAAAIPENIKEKQAIARDVTYICKILQLGEKASKDQKSRMKGKIVALKTVYAIDLEGVCP
jgi:hypothetical protein